MKSIKAILAVLGLLVTLPLWYWLLYQILVRVDASELMWFLYWVYVPFGLVVSALAKIVETKK